MNNMLSFVRLDFLAIKPYLTPRNMLIFVAVALIMILSSGTSIAAISIIMGYATIYSGFTFAVGEQNGIDALYNTLAIGRSTVVSGRYLFTALLNLSAGAGALLLSLTVLTFTGKEVEPAQSLAVTLVLFLVYSVIQAIQLPIYFKLGYSKAKLLIYMPFVGVALLMMAFTNYFIPAIPTERMEHISIWLETHMLVSTLCIISLLSIIMAASYKRSVYCYNKREF